MTGTDDRRKVMIYDSWQKLGSIALGNVVVIMMGDNVVRGR